MLRTLNFIMVCTSIVALVGVYGLKYSVEETAGEKVRVERQIDRQESELSLLQADWAYLNQPAHVAPIVTRHAEALGLLPTKPQQFGSITDLPMRPVVQKDDVALDDLFQSLEAGIDPIEQLIEANQ
jgi:hypothetical protein